MQAFVLLVIMTIQNPLSTSTTLTGGTTVMVVERKAI